MSAVDRREQLLDVTKELVGEIGFHGVSIEAVARRAGITRPIVYGHFSDLGGLMEAMIEREGRRALAQLAKFLPSSDGGEVGQLLEAFEGYLKAVREDPVTWRLVLMPPEGAPASLRDQVAAGRAAVYATLAAFVRPSLDSPDPELTARILSTVADEAARLLLTSPEEYPPERLLVHARWLLDRIGLGREGAGPPLSSTPT